MDELVDNQKALYRKFVTVVEYTTKVMHLVTTVLYLLYVNSEEKDEGKEREATLLLYNFVADDVFKIMMDKPMKKEDYGASEKDPDDKEGS